MLKLSLNISGTIPVEKKVIHDLKNNKTAGGKTPVKILKF